jgi:hypothetical protein
MRGSAERSRSYRPAEQFQEQNSGERLALLIPINAGTRPSPKVAPLATHARITSGRAFQEGHIQMKLSELAAAALISSALSAQAQATDPGVELAFMPHTMTVTLLNEGGKYVAIDLKHIPQGATCRMDKDSTIARVGPGASPGTTRVRYAAAQVSPGGCPFLTAFDLPDADYAAARAVFLQAQDNAWKKVDQIKKDLGEKWDEVIGKKNNS